MTVSNPGTSVAAAGPAVPRAIASALVAMPSDSTGISTFERYLWQAKLAVNLWLTALADTALIGIVCEQVEDLAVVSSGGYRFAQLKTRDKGSWSVAKIVAEGHAIDRLFTSYLSAKQVGIHEISTFEAWLEGPPSEDRETSDFFADPTSASTKTKQSFENGGYAVVR